MNVWNLIPVSPSRLRREVHARNLTRATAHEQEMTYGREPCVIYCEDESGGHGNFLSASYRRICADEEWRERLQKTYTSSARVPRSSDRHRGELECASSSDALLMNIFCYPGVLRRPAVCRLMGIDAGQRAEFGVRARISMHRDEIDRTEVDMRLGALMVEAKLTETGFGTASRERAFRYAALPEVFDVDELPWGARGLEGYQLVRGVLAAHESDASFLLLCDARRPDLQQMWFRVLRAVRRCDLRSRMALLTWQELAATLSPAVSSFLAEKYGIES